MGDRIYLSFFVDEDNLFKGNQVSMWFQDINDKYLNIGDNYNYFANHSSNKKEIKHSLRNAIPDKKGLYKELKVLINKMNEYKKQ